MKPQMTTESVDLDEPFLIEFSEAIPAEVESNDTSKVATETTDDD